MAGPDFSDEILERFRAEYPLVLTTSHVAEMMHSTIGDVRDKVHRGELRAFRWGQQLRFLREEVLEDMKRYTPGEPCPPQGGRPRALLPPRRDLRMADGVSLRS